MEAAIAAPTTHGVPPRARALPPHTPRPYPLPVATSPRIAALAATAPRDPGAVARFWTDVEAVGTPLVEPGGVVTFLWRDAEAEAVVLHVNKLTDYNDLRQSLMSRVPETDVWHLSYRLPPTWRASYSIGPLPVPVREPDPTTGPDREYWQWLRSHMVTDPLNRSPLPDKPGQPPLSTVALAGAPAQPWLAPRPGVPAGAVTRHPFARRTVWVYEPAGHCGRDLPVVVLFDGDVWGGEGALGSTVDNLVADGRIPPAVVLMVDSVDVPTRVRDLACEPSFVDLVTDGLLPWAAERWPITADPARTVAAGQSLGGLAAAYCALRAPHRVGAVLTQSGSFWYPGGTPHDAGARWLTAQFVVSPRLPVRWYLEVGVREWELLDPTRHLRDVLLAKGYPVTYDEFDGGHDIACWRGGLADGLIALLS